MKRFVLRHRLSVCGLTALLLAVPQPLVWASNQSLPAGYPVLRKAEQELSRGNVDAARALYRALYGQVEDAWEPLVGLGQIEAQLLQFAKAERWYEQAVDVAPARLEVLIGLARLYHHWATTPAEAYRDPSKSTPAIEVLAAAKKIDPDHPSVLALEAEMALDASNMARAQKVLQKLSQENPDTVEGLKQETKLYLKLGETRRAKESVQRAIEMAPGDPALYLMSAQLLALMDIPDEAIRQAHRSERLDFAPNYERDYLLAQEYNRLGQVEKAKEYTERALRFTPRDPKLLARWASLKQSLGESDGSVAGAFQEAARLDPKIEQAILLKAFELAQQGQIPAAMQQYEQLLQLLPTSADAILALSNLHYYQWLQGALDDAKVETLLQQLGSLQRQVEQGTLPQLDPETVVLSRLKLAMALSGTRTPGIEDELRLLANRSANGLIQGQAYYLLGELNKAHDALEIVDGETPEGYLLAAESLRMIQESEYARQFYLRGSRMKPLNGFSIGLRLLDTRRQQAERLLSLGNKAYDRQDFGESLSFYQQALSLEPEYVTIWLRIADAAEGLKRYALAQRAITFALEYQPGLAQSKQLQKRLKQLEKKQRPSRWKFWKKQKLKPPTALQALQPYIPGFPLPETLSSASNQVI